MLTFNRVVSLVMVALVALIFGLANFTYSTTWVGSQTNESAFNAGAREYRAIKPCQYEDGSGARSLPCAWDARHQGNGEGRSLIHRRDGSVQFVSHRFAHHAIQAWIDAAHHHTWTPGGSR